MRELGLTATELAKRFGMTQPAVSYAVIRIILGGNRVQRHIDSHLVEGSLSVIEHHRNNMAPAAGKDIRNVAMVLDNFSQILFKCRGSITGNLLKFVKSDNKKIVRLWDTVTWEPVEDRIFPVLVPGGMAGRSAGLSQDGKQLAGIVTEEVQKRQVVQLWDLTPDEWHRYLGKEESYGQTCDSIPIDPARIE